MAQRKLPAPRITITWRHDPRAKSPWMVRYHLWPERPGRWIGGSRDDPDDMRQVLSHVLAHLASQGGTCHHAPVPPEKLPRLADNGR